MQLKMYKIRKSVYLPKRKAWKFKDSGIKDDLEKEFVTEAKNEVGRGGVHTRTVGNTDKKIT